MRILVIGSTGRTGRHVLSRGVERGHEITAFARRPELLPEDAALAGVHRGDAHDLDAVRDAVRGQDAVVAAVGGSRIASTLITAMREHGVRRVVMTSSRSVPATRPRPVVALAWLFLREVYADLARAEGMLQVSGLDWSIARGTRLTDKPPAGRVHIDFEANATGGAMHLSRADYATALLDIAEDPAMIGRAAGICGP
ncbi:NAD(P)-dependent oxidoreductase [Actinomadura sp. WMMB 499]|uniref:NAD(P)-dependent oxidoreductase n=1 Tax=Actinomadura sp. WMMB 499 TaxID=1219491 RepID=UPI0012480A1C|nr:NAD(P)-binding oxidoreductase [Actinomadura sp. WMMB 499]QFG20996.1 NAD(P)H-binding protein [Actinomadura sp. WMMB 499]